MGDRIIGARASSVVDRVVGIDEEPIDARSADQAVRRVVGKHSTLVERVGLTIDHDPFLEGLRALADGQGRIGPLGEDGVQGRGVDVVGRRAADEDVVAAAGDRIAPRAAGGDSVGFPLARSPLGLCLLESL